MVKIHTSVRFRRTTLIIAFSVAVVLGVAGAINGINLGASYAVTFFIATIVVSKNRKIPALISILLLGFALGSWRGTVFGQLLNPVNDLYGKRVILTGVATSDGTYTNNSQLSFDVGDIVFSDPIEVRIPGKIKVEGFGANVVYRGDVVQVEGKIQDSLGSRQGRVGFANIEVVGRNNSFIESTRHRFIAGMQSALPEPQASFGLGLLVGEKSTLPKRVSNNLSAVGLTHIIAVSGYNLTIIIIAIRRMMRKCSKYQTVFVVVALLGLFVLMTGFSASIVRASIVSMLSIVAWYYGRTFRPMLLITLTAAVTALWNPLYVWSDAGWYLSFLAFFGVLVLAPMIASRIKRRRSKGVLGMLIIESLSAQLMTMPFILFTFKQISMLALPANILVVPFVPIAMALSLIAGMAGMLVVSISGWLAWPAKILLTYMLDLAALFSRAPHAVMYRTLSIAGLAIIYGFFLFGVLILSRSIVRRVKVVGTDHSSQ